MQINDMSPASGIEDNFATAIQSLEKVKLMAEEYAAVGELHNALFEEIIHTIETIIKDLERS